MNANANDDNANALRQAQIAGAVAEVDPRQVAMLRRLTPAQRFAQMQSMIDLVEGIAAYRLRQRKPDLSEAEALLIIRSRDVDLSSTW